jgi:uncharacterized membrane protein
MLEIFIIGTAVVLAIFAFILWIESILNHNDEFLTIKEWHNFQQSMSKKGNK